MGERKYMIIIGGGKVGWNLARELLERGPEVTAMVRSARLMPARSSTHSSVASPYWIACSSSCSTVR